MRMSYLAGAMFGLLCAACATPPDSAARVDDALFVLPGPFSEQTTLADLQVYFGRANVRIVEPGDNAGERRVVLFEADPSRRAFVEFHDAAKLAGVRSIAVRDAASRWRGKQGVHVGMSFAALQAPLILSSPGSLGRIRPPPVAVFPDRTTLPDTSPLPVTSIFLSVVAVFGAVPCGFQRPLPRLFASA